MIPRHGRSVLAVALVLATAAACAGHRGARGEDDARSRAWIGHDLADIEAVFGTDTTVDVHDGYLRVRIFQASTVVRESPLVPTDGGFATPNGNPTRPPGSTTDTRFTTSRNRRATFWLDDRGIVVRADVVADRRPPADCAHRVRPD